MLNNSDKYKCRVCGYRLSEKPWGEDQKSPTFEYCDCCGIQFGYHDCLLEAIRKHRLNWIENGALWSEPSEKSEGWNLEDQLKQIPEEYK